jgi:hypothetical protein
VGNNLPPRVIRPSAFVPTQPRSGSVSDDIIYRMSNAIIQGTNPLTYINSYAGSNSLSESIAVLALTGTLAIANGSATVTGSGTQFVTELNPGQYVLVVDSATHKSYLLGVKTITDATHFTAWRAVDETASTLTGNRLPLVFAVDQDRGSVIWGNFIRNDKGTLLGVGAGVARLNGSTLSGSWTLTRHPAIALLNAGTYTNFQLGMTTPVIATPPVAVAGGTKGMRAGNYSLVATAARTQTLGYNNPSLKNVVTIADNDQITYTFPAMANVSTTGQNAYDLWVTRYADSLGADLNYLEGPWYFLDTYTGSTAGFTANVEWLDAEVERNDLITFNNDPPPDANWVAMLNNVPVWISCQGPNSSSPGPFIFPAKPGNIEAAPVDIAFASSPPETIIGAVSASGRIYLLTTNHLEIAQGTPQADVPVLIRPFWTVGFARPDQLVFINDTLYGHSVQGPARSSSDGVSGSEEFDFAVAVSEFTDAWVAGHVTVAYDPKNNAVCYFHAAESLNSSGFWTTRCLMFGLRQNAWIGDLTFSSTTQDMIVTSAAMVGNRLYMLIGGRLANDTVSIGTYQFDAAAGSAVSWYVAPVFSDNGVETRSHVVKRVRATYKGTGVTVGVFGAQPTESIPVTSLETGNSSSLTGAISVPTSTTPTQSLQLQVNCPNLVQSTVRVEGSYAGSGTVDSVHEIVIQAAEEGCRI